MTDEVVVPLRDRRTSLNLAAGAVLLLAFAAGAAAGVAGVDDPTIAVRVVMGLLGAVCLVGGVACVLALRVVLSPRAVVTDRVGLHWRVSKDAWMVPWDELAAVAVHTGWTTRPSAPRRYARVSLGLQPAGPGFLLRHPELRTVQAFGDGEREIRIPFADRPDLVAPQIGRAHV